MFHMEQFLVLFLLGVAVAPLPCSAEFFSAEMQPQEIIVCGGEVTPEAQRLTNLGLEFFLCGDTTSASKAFAQADAAGNTSPLNDIGHILCAASKEARTAALTLLNEKMEDEHLSMTPQEEFFLKALLLFINGDMRGSAEEFLSHAEHYRNDRLSRAWGILLLHYASNDDATQQRVLNLASDFYTRFPKSATSAYVRALSEEFFPKEQISGDALSAAQTAAQILPSAHMLHGHMLFRAGRAQEAADVFHVIRERAEKNSYAYFSAGLYEATALWCLGKADASLQLRRELNAAITLKAAPATDAELLWRWEINSLPLRVMVTRPEKITYTEIRAAKKAATGQGGDEHLSYRDCLVNLILARYHAQKGKKGLASKFLNDAEGHYQHLQEKKIVAEIPLDQTLYLRACQACELGILTVRAELFKSTSETWKQRKAELEKPSSMLLPPVLPERFETRAQQ